MPVQQLNFKKREACPGCHSTEYSVLASIPLEDDRIWPFLQSHFESKIPKEAIIGKLYEIAKCTKCRLIRQLNILDDEGMNVLYSEWIDPNKSLNKRETAGIGYYINSARSIFIASRLMPSGNRRFLDFGMGWGHLCFAANALGLEASGLELSPERQEYAKARGVRVIDDIEGLPDGLFGFVNADQVLEHLPDPKGSLEQAFRILAKGGVLHVAVPDGSDSEHELASKVFHMKKGALQALEHINTFTPETLKHICESTGFRLIKPLILPRLADCVITNNAAFIPDGVYLKLRKTSLYFVKP